MASSEGKRHHRNLVPLAALISKEMRSEKMEKPTVRYGHAAQSRKGEDYFLIKTDCQRVPGNSSSAFSVFAVNFLPYSLKFYFAMPHELDRDVQLSYMLLNHYICTEFMVLSSFFMFRVFFSFLCSICSEYFSQFVRMMSL